MKITTSKIAATVLGLFLILVLFSQCSTNAERFVLGNESELNLSEGNFRMDTVITFNPDTYEEVIEIIKVDVSNNTLSESMDSHVKAGTIDTIITFNPDTGEETIRIIHN